VSFVSVFDQTLWSSLGASSMSSGARIALVVLAGLLVLILGFLLVFGAVLRRRARDAEPAARGEARVASDPDSQSGEVGLGEYVATGRSFSRASAGGGGLEVAHSDGRVCPTCRREFDTHLSFCPHDARRLVPAPEMLDPARKDGSICPSCNRSYDSGVRFCPHDASELLPVAVYTATSRRQDRKPTGVIAKICPQCQRRYDLSASFCANDSAELVVIN
jgi:hypothetical protein